MDRIGLWRGEPISEMNREQLLEFAEWAGKRIWDLQQKVGKAQPHLLDLEIKERVK